MKEAAEFAESTQILMNVSEFTDVSQATDTLISAVQAFGYTAETSMDVVDLLNTIGNNYAISTADLAQSLTKSSASLVAAGGDLAEAAALTATANAIIQDADSVGTALKTTSLRLRGTSVKVLEEEGLDSDGAIESTSKLRSQVLATSGVDILTDSGAYKSTYQILLEIAEVWDQITDDKARAGLLELLAGKRNSSVIAALLQSPEKLKAAYKDAQNASGSALKENEKYLDSIQGKIDQFNNAVQALWSDTLNSDVVKFFVDLATKLVKLVDAVGPLNIALVGLVAFLEKKHGVFSNFFNPDGSGAEELKNQLEKAKQDLAKATQADMQHGSKKTAQNRRDAEERVAILKSKIQESSSEAILDGIDESFDPGKVKKQITGKKGAITKRAKKLESEGMSFAQIQEDPKIKQWTQEVKEGEQALNDYNVKVAQADAILKQKNATTVQAASVENTKAGAEVRDAAATNAGANADVLATMASDGKVASTWADVWATLISKDATLADVGAKIKQLLITKLLNTEYVKQAILNGQLTVAQMANMTMTQLLGLGFKGLAQSIGQATAKMWAFMTATPIGWIMLAVAAVVALGAAFAAVHKTSAELKEELDELKSELQGIQSELDSVNSELKTTQERMAELLAMDKLSFAEQKELENLKKQNEELERQARLLEAQEERKREAVSEKAAKTFDKQMKESGNGFWDKTGIALAGSILGTFLGPGVGNMIGGAIGAGVANLPTEFKLNSGIGINGVLADVKTKLEDMFYGLDDEKYDKALPFIEPLINGVDKLIQDNDEYVDSTLAAMKETLDGVEYGYGSDEQLDKYYNLAYKREIAAGTIGAESDGLAHIFSRPEHETAKKGIDNYVQLLKDGNENAKTEIEKIISNNAALVADIKAMGLEITDAVDYFTMQSSSSSNNIMAQYGVAVTALKKLQSGTINLDDLVKYDKKDGEATGRADAIAEQLKGVSPEVREQFTSIVEEIKEGAYDTKEGLADWDSAIRKMELQGMQAVLANTQKELEGANKLAFPDLEISGWIDSIDELSGAFESLSSAMDLIVTAQEQMDNSGRISMKTALDLMATTDDWNQILEVNNGVIIMNANAEQILIQSKLNLIKANIEMALQQVETDIALMEGAINSTKAGNAFTQGFTKALTNAQGVLVGLKAGWDAFWAGGDVASAFNGAYKSTVDNLTPDESSLGELYSQRANLLKQREMLEGVDTTQEFKNNYDFDKTPGDKYDDEEDAANDAFQREMDYWENRLSANQSRADRLQNTIDLLEQKGMKAGEQYYRDQMKLLSSVDGTDGIDSKLELLHQKLGAVNVRLGETIEGSEEWWEAAQEYNDIINEIQEIESSIVDLQDAIGEIDTYKFEEFNNRLDDITSKLGTIRNLIASDEEDWFDDEGNWTDDGIAVLGTYIQELETYKQGYDEVQGYLDDLSKYEYNEANARLLADKFGIHSEQEYYDKMQELMDQQYDYAESINDTEESIVDMYESSIDAVEEYIDTLIDGYNDYIDSVKEALDAERALYDFKKNVQKQAKDISELERRIASLSGSTNKSDIAERRKLEAQLYESRESLNDTYYDHAKDAQSEALDAEQEAYETAMTKMVDKMRISLEEATADMAAFLDSVTIAVSMNADTVLEKYRETEVPLNDAITNPWEEAAKKVGEYGGDATKLMDVWKADGYFAEFSSEAGINLSSPWSSGSDAAAAFKDSVDVVMDDVVRKIETNVQSASTKLSNLYQQIRDTEEKAKNANVDIGDLDDNSSGDTYSGGSNVTDNSTTTIPKPATPTRPAAPTRPSFIKALNRNTGLNIGSKKYSTSEYNNLAVEGKDGIYFPYTAHGFENAYVKKGEGFTTERSGSGYKIDFHSWKPVYLKYAKGTTGTKRDEWAITDEPQFGDELVLVPGKDGNLSFMRKGTGVVPADLTANLMEWGQFTPDAMNLGGGVNVNMINNAVNKPEFNFAFDALVKAENITEETLPAVKKLVTQELNRFTKELNYALKGKGAR